MPSRIAFVTSTPLSVAGGSGTYVGIDQLARALDDRNIRVEMQFPVWWSPTVIGRRISLQKDGHLGAAGSCKGEGPQYSDPGVS